MIMIKAAVREDSGFYFYPSLMSSAAIVPTPPIT